MTPELMIAEAERNIARILADLEIATGLIVYSVELEETDITTIGNDRPQILRNVCIDIKPLHGTAWDC